MTRLVLTEDNAEERRIELLLRVISLPALEPFSHLVHQDIEPKPKIGLLPDRKLKEVLLGNRTVPELIAVAAVIFVLADVGVREVHEEVFKLDAEHPTRIILVLHLSLYFRSPLLGRRRPRASVLRCPMWVPQFEKPYILPGSLDGFDTKYRVAMIAEKAVAQVCLDCSLLVADSS